MIVSDSCGTRDLGLGTRDPGPGTRDPIFGHAAASLGHAGFKRGAERMPAALALSRMFLRCAGRWKAKRTVFAFPERHSVRVPGPGSQVPVFGHAAASLGHAGFKRGVERAPAALALSRMFLWYAGRRKAKRTVFAFPERHSVRVPGPGSRVPFHKPGIPEPCPPTSRNKTAFPSSEPRVPESQP